MQNLLIKIGVCLLIIQLSEVGKSQAQIPDKDLRLIENQQFCTHHYDKTKVRYLFADSKSGIVKYNPISLFFGSLMFGYQAVVSPQFAASCLYDPSCSNFSKQLIAEYGIVKGVFTSADRLTRCNKLSTIDLSKLDIDKESGKIHEHVDIYKMKK